MWLIPSKYVAMSRDKAIENVIGKVPHTNGKIPVAIGLVSHDTAVLLFRRPGDDYWPCRSYAGCSEYANFDPKDAEFD